jgi:peptidoglycan hydrolase-like amidase
VRVWGGSVPYLRSVPDPWSLDASINPSFARWTRAAGVTTLLSAFAITDGSGLASVTVTSRDESGAALRVRAVSGAGTVRTLSGEAFRSALGLPSSWVATVTLPTP